MVDDAERALEGSVRLGRGGLATFPHEGWLEAC